MNSHLKKFKLHTFSALIIRTVHVSVTCVLLTLVCMAGGVYAATNMVPTRINADKMNFDYENHVIYLRGHVVVADPQGMLYADNATVYLEKKEKESEGETENLAVDDSVGSFYRVVAFGNVRMSAEENVAICNKAVWDKENNTIVLTGGPPMLKQGSSYIEATRIVYQIDTKQVEFHPNPRVVFNDLDEETKNKFLK